MIVAAFRLYCEASLELALGYFAVAGLLRLSQRGPLGLSARVRLRLAGFGLLAAALAPALAHLTPVSPLRPAQFRVWTPLDGASGDPTIRIYHRSGGASTAWAALDAEGLRLPLGPLRLGLAALLAALAVASLARASGRVGEILRLRRELRLLPAIRKTGRVRVVASATPGSGPYSCWLPFPSRAYVVVPERLLAFPRDLAIAIRHELQHHRQRDTLAVYGLAAFRLAFPIHPLLGAWERRLHQLQELACDEALIGRRGISPQAYGRCLLRAVELAALPFAPPAGTVGMAGREGVRNLRRRIMMFSQYARPHGSRPPRSRTILAAAFASALVVSLTSVALAARDAVQDRHVTLAEAQAYADKSPTEIPLAVNELVVRQLNHYVGTPSGRAQIRDVLLRMPQYRAMIERKLGEYRLPLELLAVPAVEAGYENYEGHLQSGAGLWGFIPTSARRYGLTVDLSQGGPGGNDERLDEEKETDAAMRYFRDLFNIFHDWRLALKGYNEGEKHVIELIKRYGTRDAWELERQAEGRERYLSSVTAVLLILRNPELMN